MHGRREAKITDSDLTTGGVNENIFTFQISVDNRVRCLLVQVLKAFQDLQTPALDNPEATNFVFLDVRAKRATRDHLGDEDDLVGLIVFPC